MVAIARSAMARDSTVDGAAGSGALLSGRPHNPLVTDGLLALLMTGIALLSVIRPGEPADLWAAALGCVGALCLAGRRITPAAVLVVCAGSLSLYQALGYPHSASPLAVFIALYT